MGQQVDIARVRREGGAGLIFTVGDFAVRPHVERIVIAL